MLRCCRTGDFVTSGYYLERNGAFVSDRGLREEGQTSPSKWTLVIPNDLSQEMKEGAEGGSKDAWYLYGRETRAMGSERGRWVVERAVSWERDPVGRIVPPTAASMDKVIEALRDRKCVGTMYVVDNLDNAESMGKRVSVRARTPNVCLMKNDGTGTNETFHVGPECTERGLSILLPKL